MELLRVSHLKKVYNTRLGGKQCVALQDISFDVEGGEFVAIMGASGSGKTTLLNLIASLDKPTEGAIFLEGQDFRSIRDRELAAFRRSKLGFVFQDFNLLDTFTLRDNILLPLVLSETPLKEMKRRLPPLAQSLGIGALLDKYPYEVSGGEKQRAAVARAVITDPRLILADEPTGALDSKAAAQLLDSFTAFNAEGRTLLMVTHSARCASYAGRVLFIRDGRLYNQIYRGDQPRREFFDRIVSTLTVLTDGGADLA
ncbi:MAG: ABC transporter ATP-binding protein [Oscillospiraceae bacterium]|nr:ABC transporter ATP-binding protein [Oscillospiraceae bacterium]